MSSAEGPDSGGNRWSRFRAVRPDEPREASPLAAFLINAFLTLVAGAVGAVAMVIVAWNPRYSSGGRAWIPWWRSVDPSLQILLASTVGFAIGAGWALKAILGSRSRSRRSARRRGERSGEDGER